METFLNKLAAGIVKENEKILKDIIIIFPTRRACLYFRKELSGLLEKAAWLPRTMSISDFIENLSDYILCDRIKLIFELYKVYHSVEEKETFDSFYPWGDMLLNDFDAADKNLVDTKTLFKVITDYKEIEEKFETELSLEYKRFWDSARNYKTNREEDNNFIKIWEIIGIVFEKFKENLKNNNYAYEGMMYRDLYERLEKDELEIKWKKTIFAGFNYLSKSEEGIIRYFLKKRIGEIYFDADKYYLDDNKQEAGYFIRRNIKRLELEKSDWTENIISEDKKYINVISTPLAAGMVKGFGYELSKFLREDKSRTEQTAVILPDESLLLPVLYSIPDEVDKMNVTMGFPFRFSSFYSFFRIIMDLQKNSRERNGKVEFYYKDIERVLLHSFVKYKDTGKVFELYHKLKDGNIIFAGKEIIANVLKEKKENAGIPEILNLILKRVKDYNEMYRYFTDIVKYISEDLEKRKDEGLPVKFINEFLYNFYFQINRLKDVTEEYSITLENETYWRLADEIFRGLQITFTGEPLEGLQIMGLLESRILDFENVFVLSVNEGIMPKGIGYTSFIPYTLRKIYGMLMPEEEDSITAYYFYRLIQRAKNIFLFYDSNTDNNRYGGISRYILQLENELLDKNLEIKYEKKILTLPVELTKPKEIIVKKRFDEGTKLMLSASSISTYINCPLQYFLKYVAKLEEDEDIEEVMEQKGLGLVFHSMMNTAYEGYKGKELNSQDIEKIENEIIENFDEEFMERLREEYKEGSGFFELKGRNLLYKNVVKELMKRAFKCDKELAPFEIKDTEKKVRAEINIGEKKQKEIILKGIIDRIHIKDGRHFIIDYKTGNVDLKKIVRKENEEYIEKVFNDPGYRLNLQLMLYEYIYGKTEKAEDIVSGIFPLKDIRKGIKYIGGMENMNESEKESMMNYFGERLGKKIEDITEESGEFRQTEQKERCINCGYRSICYR